MIDRLRAWRRRRQIERENYSDRITLGEIEEQIENGAKDPLYDAIGDEGLRREAHAVANRIIDRQHELALLQPHRRARA